MAAVDRRCDFRGAARSITHCCMALAIVSASTVRCTGVMERSDVGVLSEREVRPAR